MMKSFDEKDELYRIAHKSMRSECEITSAEVEAQFSKPDVEARFERLTFMKRLLIGAPQLVGYRRAWDMYNDILSGNAEYAERLYGKNFAAPEFADFSEFRSFHRVAVNIIMREEERAKAPKRRKSAAENEGYSEPVVEPALEHPRFLPETVIKSLVEDKWKADYYVFMCERLKDVLNPDLAEVDSDSFDAVLKRATEQYLRNQSRPILTNELSDYSNPFMMKKAATARLLHEGCVRNKLEETLVSELLESDPSLVKLRSQASLPAEVLEPLQAFRGLTNWSFDPEIRMEQKIDALLDITRNLLAGKEAMELETSEPILSNGRIKHPYRNHVGFVSSAPKGRVGGWGHGKPVTDEKTDLEKVRYPTLQRVAHSLPQDAQYRSQAMHAIQVLERSRGWEFSDKTKAVNALKEVLDTLPASKMIAGKLNRALPVVRYGRFAPGTLSSSHKFVRRRPSNLLRRNRIRMYFRSVTATVPLNRRWAERKTKNQQRSKKKDSRK